MTKENSRKVAKYFNTKAFTDLPGGVRVAVYSNLEELNTLNKVKSFIKKIHD